MLVTTTLSSTTVQCTAFHIITVPDPTILLVSALYDNALQQSFSLRHCSTPVLLHGLSLHYYSAA